MKYIDPNGKALFLSVDKAKQKMNVFLCIQVGQSSMFVSFTADITTHVVANSDSSQPDKTANVNISRKNHNGSNWTQFPNGVWNITEPVDTPSQNIDTYAEKQLRTDAVQTLPVLNKDGTTKLNKDGSVSTVEDRGYNIHFTTNSNTAGCIGVKDKDDMDLIITLYNINEIFDPGNTKIKVFGTEE